MNQDPQQLLRKWLADEHGLRVAKNPRFSFRAFARKLQISPSALSEILSGKRLVSETRAVALLLHVEDSEAKIERLRSAYKNGQQLKRLKRYDTPYEEEILPEQFSKFLADWRYFAVMSLLRAQPILSKSASEVISDRLQIDQVSLQAILTELSACALIKSDDDGFLRCTPKVFRSPPGYPGRLLQKRAKEGFMLATQAMNDHDKWHYVDFVTITTDPQRLDEAVGMIDEFVKRLGVFLGTGEGSEVFELSVNLFSLSRIVKRSAHGTQDLGFLNA